MKPLKVQLPLSLKQNIGVMLDYRIHTAERGQHDPLPNSVEEQTSRNYLCNATTDGVGMLYLLDQHIQVNRSGLAIPLCRSALSSYNRNAHALI